MAAVLLLVCLFASHGGAAVFIEFNRTIYPINPGLRFSPLYSRYVSRPANPNRQDPSSWALEFDLRNVPHLNDSLYLAGSSPAKVSYTFNGTGMEVFMTPLESGPGSPKVSCLTGGRNNTPADTQVRRYGYNQEMSFAAGKENQTTQYRVDIEFELQQRWAVNNITCTYMLPIDDDHKLDMTEISANATAISPSLPISPRNDTWLSGALDASREALSGNTAPAAMSSSSGRLVDLPPNVTFVSVLGPRYMTQGQGGECRFVFDPPFILRGMTPYDVNYTYVFTGNPYSLKMSSSGDAVGAPRSNWPGGTGEADSELPRVINDVHLLNQQLDPRIRYKFAIVDGADSGAAGTNGAAQTPSSCDFTKILLWQSVPDPSRQTNATQATAEGSAGLADARSRSHGMGPGVIAGTVVGVTLGVALLMTLAACLWRRRRRNPYGDLDDIQDDTKATPYVAPLGPASDASLLREESDTSKQPRDASPRRLVRREEDAGALPGNDEVSLEFDVLPPLYREEWNTAVNTRTGEGSRPSGEAVVRPTKRRRPSGPRRVGASNRTDQTPITNEEIKFLGAPVTSNLPGGLGLRHQCLTPEERKRLAGSQVTVRDETSRSSHIVALEDMRLSTRTSFTESSSPGSSEDHKRAGSSQPSGPAVPPSRQAKGKGVMEGEKTPVE